MSAQATMSAEPKLITVGTPDIDDGVRMHQLAAESKVLDVNSRYAYLLWCRDFAATSVIARMAVGGADGEAGDDEVVGFVTGYRRPDQPRTLMIWQVAVSQLARGQGLAARMLDAVFDQAVEQEPTDHLETTITPDNDASIALFKGFANRRDAGLERIELFDKTLLGSGHLPEQRYRIGPISTATQRSRP